MQIEGMVNTIF